MLAEKNRLKKEKDFQDFKKIKESFKGDFLILKKKKNNFPLKRFGFVVSKKVSPKAVVRNKIKRILREAVREKIEAIKEGYDIVFFAKGKSKEELFSSFKKEIGSLLKKADLLK